MSIMFKSKQNTKNTSKNKTHTMKMSFHNVNNVHIIKQNNLG